MSPTRLASAPPPARQRGVVLFISLIVLVAMTLAAIAMLRAVDTGLLITGNIAFRQSATASADSSLEAAIAWLSDPANASLLAQDRPESGYFSTWQNGFDPTGVTARAFVWSGNSIALDHDAAGNSVRFVIHRMCQSPGPADPGLCMMAGIGSLAGSTFAAPSYSKAPLLDNAYVYYRITARVDGPRNSVSYVQALVH